jgi:hypothetical protein
MKGSSNLPHKPGGTGNNNKTRMKGAEANHLLNFQYSRPNASLNTPSKSYSSSGYTRKTPSAKAKRSIMTKTQFLQANFKFIVNPFIPASEEGFYNPDSLVPWDYIEEVVFTSSNKDIERTCPICLDPLKTARITRCGHIFWYFKKFTVYIFRLICI